MKSSLKSWSAVILLMILYILLVIYVLYNSHTKNCSDKIEKSNTNHTCIDISHKTCDSSCECDGFECNNSK